MNDLISRQAAIEALAKFVPYAICDESTESYTNGLTDAYNLICQLPSAQPEIIRCKNCKWNKADKWVDCACVMNGMYGRTTDNYCSLAERKKE